MIWRRKALAIGRVKLKRPTVISGSARMSWMVLP
jgi:hypothetical protein